MTLVTLLVLCPPQKTLKLPLQFSTVLNMSWRIRYFFNIYRIFYRLVNSDLNLSNSTESLDI